MNEPANHTAWVDRLGDTWVRFDEASNYDGNWWPLTDGPAWEPRVRNGVGQSRSWGATREYQPFKPADRARTARALARVRQERSR